MLSACVCVYLCLSVCDTLSVYLFTCLRVVCLWVAWVRVCSMLMRTSVCGCPGPRSLSWFVNLGPCPRLHHSAAGSSREGAEPPTARAPLGGGGGGAAGGGSHQTASGVDREPGAGRCARSLLVARHRLPWGRRGQACLLGGGVLWSERASRRKAAAGRGFPLCSAMPALGTTGGRGHRGPDPLGLPGRAWDPPWSAERATVHLSLA